jgi:hypothetical protein
VSLTRFVPLAIIASTLARGALEAAPAPPWIALEGGPKYALPADGDRSVVTIPVTFTVTPTGPVRLRIRDVLYDNRYDDRIRRSFAVPETIAVSDPRYAAAITITGSNIEQEGLYLLHLEASAGENVEVLSVQLERPAAQLQAVPDVVIRQRRVLGWMWREEATPLVLHEIGRRSRLTDVRIQPVPAGGEAGTADGTIGVRLLPATLAPGLSATPQLGTIGRFPLGISQRSLEVVAPQLAAPLPLSVRVDVRQHPFIIVVLSLAGLALGFLLRVFLARRVQVSEARLRLFTTLEDVARRRGERPDAPFQARLQPLERTLRDAVRLTDPAAIDAAIAAFSTQLQQELKDLDTARAAAAAGIDVLAEVVSRRWSVPATMAAALARAAATLDETRRLNDAYYVSDAQGRLAAALSTLIAELDPLVTDWRDAVSAALRRLSAAPLPVSVTAAIAPAVAALGERIDHVPAHLDPRATASAIEEACAAVDVARSSLRSFLRQFCEWIASTPDEIAAALGTSAAAESMPVVRAFVTELREATDASPEQAIELLVPARLVAVDESLAKAVTDYLDGLALAPSPEVEAALAARDYRLAARLAHGLQGPAMAATGLEIAVAAPAALAPWVAPSVLPPLARHDVRVLTAASPLVRPSAVTAPGSLRTLLVAKGVRAALAAIGISGVAFLLFESTFIGTAADIARVMLWAFGLDVTVDVLTTQAGQLFKRAQSG